MSARTGLFSRAPSIRGLAVLFIIIVYGGVTTYYVMSDTSVRGLTVKMFCPSRSFPADSGIFDRAVTYNIPTSVWSTHSLRTSLSSVQFSLAVDGTKIGTTNETGASFEPGNSAPFVLTFKHLNVDPNTLPRSPELVLSMTATVTAGIVTSTLTRSDSLVRDFASPSC